MHSKLKALTVVTVVTVTTIFVQGLPQANAETDSFAYAAYAGGTKITAVGTTISSDLTAESAVTGKQPQADTNKVASVRVGGLAQVGAVDTDASAVRSGTGFKTTAHAHTANISLLNGRIKVSALDTISKAESNGTDDPTGSTSTELIGLTIAGKKYPVNVPANSGITIPGIARVVINASQTATSGESVITQGAALYVTLLKAQNGVAAGATVIVNPTYTLITPATDTAGGFQLGGGGLGAYAFAHVGDEIEAETGKLGGKMMPPLGTNGVTLSNTTGRVNVPQLLNVDAIESTVTGISIPALSEATVTSKLADLRLFPSLSGALISAKAIGSTSHVRVEEGETAITEGNLQFINLKVAGNAIPVDVAPNTTINVAGLGKVVINEHKELRVPGFHAYQVIALHITLDTAKAGLPVGAEVQIGASQAIVYG